MDSNEFKEKTRKHYIESLETALAEQKAIIRELKGKTMTKKQSYQDQVETMITNLRNLGYKVEKPSVMSLLHLLYATSAYIRFKEAEHTVNEMNLALDKERVRLESYRTLYFETPEYKTWSAALFANGGKIYS